MTTTTLPDDLKAIEKPTILPWPEKPDDANEFTTVAHVAAYSFGWSVELREHPDGRCLEVRTTNTTYPRFRVFSSRRAWGINDMSHAVRDCERYGGRFFPSDYERLRIIRQSVRSEVSVTGWRHAPSCDCSICGKEVSYQKASYAHSEKQGYFPFCLGCYVFALDIPA